MCFPVVAAATVGGGEMASPGVIKYCTGYMASHEAMTMAAVTRAKELKGQHVHRMATNVTASWTRLEKENTQHRARNCRQSHSLSFSCC